MDTINNEAVTNLLAELHIDPAYSSPSLNAMAAAESRYLKELKLNVATVLGGNNILIKSALLIALSVAINEKNATLINALEARLSSLCTTAVEIC
jgi:alkyl hydroperoxide reductase subunit D